MTANLAFHLSSVKIDTAPADWIATDDGAILDRADYCREQSEAWLHIARRYLVRYGKGYRTAISRAGTWARRAQLATVNRPEVTRSERLRLAQWETEATRYDAWIGDAQLRDCR